MGRFGNQADHLLGSIAFAKKLNKTLIIPPFIYYNFGSLNSYISFDDWFDLSALNQYHRSLTMKHFMKELAPKIWKEDQRVVTCHEVASRRSKDRSCPAKNGNPFGPFWDHFNVTFVGSKLFELSFHSSAEEWRKAFPTKKNFVLTFMGAMAAYPVLEEHRYIQKYIEWSSVVSKKRDEFISSKLNKPYLAIHLRNGMDWKRACDHIDEKGINYHFMSSPQCVGYNSHRLFTRQMCLPSKDIVKEQVLDLMIKHHLKALFIATDSDSMISDFQNLFSVNNLQVDIVVYPEKSLQMDLAIMIEADYFIGTCASSVSAFSVRKRECLKKPYEFFAVSNQARHTEL